MIVGHLGRQFYEITRFLGTIWEQKCLYFYSKYWNNVPKMIQWNIMKKITVLFYTSESENRPVREF